MLLPNSFQNSIYFSLSFFSIFSNSEIIFFSKFFEITCNSAFCCNISLEILSDKLSQSTSPEIKLKYSGIKSSHFSIINTFLV